MPRRFPPLLVIFAAAATLLAGCETQRTITVTSDPSGALLFLNDEEVGRTPVTVPFTFYGVYSVRLEHQGFHPLWTKHDAPSPWWEFPGPDLAALLIPNKQVAFHWHFGLQPLPMAAGVSAIDEAALLARAQQMRGLTSQPATTATPVAATPSPTSQPTTHSSH